MESPDTHADAVQPPGQDAGGQGQSGFEGLYDLSSAPEELRPQLEEHLKKIDGNVTKKFMEHADYRKRWEPFEGIEGLTDVPADDLTQLLELHRIAQNPEQFEEWWVAVGRDAGLLDDDDGDNTEGLEGDAGDDTVSELRGMVESLQQELREFKESGSRDQRVQDAHSQLTARFKELEAEHGELDDDSRATVNRLAMSYVDDDDPLGKAFDEFLRIKGGAQTELVEDRLGQPAGANGAGRADTSPEPIKSFQDAKRAAAERLVGAGG